MRRIVFNAGNCEDRAFLPVSLLLAPGANVKSLTINVTDVQLGDVTANAKLVLTAGNGKQKRVTFLLGFNF